jgi:hypothetical protein
MSVCSVCYEFEATHAFFCKDALHQCVCENCSKPLIKCPICRYPGKAVKVVQCSDIPAEKKIEEKIEEKFFIFCDYRIKRIFDKADVTEQNRKNYINALKILRENNFKPFQTETKILPGNIIRIINRKCNGTLQLSANLKFLSFERGMVYHHKGFNIFSEVFYK